MLHTVAVSATHYCSQFGKPFSAIWAFPLDQGNTFLQSVWQILIDIFENLLNDSALVVKKANRFSTTHPYTVHVAMCGKSFKTSAHLSVL